jgi:hypothetical protein
MKSANEEAGKGRGALPYCCEVEERAGGAGFSKIAKAQREWMSCGAPSVQRLSHYLMLPGGGRIQHRAVNAQCAEMSFWGRLTTNQSSIHVVLTEAEQLGG